MIELLCRMTMTTTSAYYMVAVCQALCIHSLMHPGIPVPMSELRKLKDGVVNWLV
jgi:hypothetical protein